MKRRNNANIPKQKTAICQVYGIFNFKTGKMVSVNLDIEQLELEFDLDSHDNDECKIVSFNIMLVY